MKRVVVTAVSFVIFVPAGLGVLHNGWFGQAVPVRVPSHATVSQTGSHGGDQTSVDGHSVDGHSVDGHSVDGHSVDGHSVEPISESHAHPKTTHEHHSKHGKKDEDHPKATHRHHSEHGDKKAKHSEKKSDKKGQTKYAALPGDQKGTESVLLPTHLPQPKHS